MKKIFQYSILMLTAIVLVLTGCKKEELVFEHEKSMFPLKENAVLIEAIVPMGTSSSDEIYITGPFAGDEMIPLQKATESNAKWGVYILESDYHDGKTLADGFYFFSKKEGEERDLRGDSVMHYLTAQPGTTNNVYVMRWASYFNGGGNKHEGYVIYIENQSDWDDVLLYGWADGQAEIFGAWPGAKVNGLETVYGTEYRYIDCGTEFDDMTYNLIFNNGNGKQFNGPALTLNKNYFIRIKEDLTFEIFEPEQSGHNGPVIYVLDGLEWGKSITCYMYGDVNDLGKDGGATAGWPGRTIDGVETVGAHSWYYFDMGEACVGKKESLIFSKNGAMQLGDLFDYTIEKDKNLYVYLAPDKKVVEVEDPMNIDPSWTIYEAIEKEPETAIIYLCVYDSTSLTFHTMSDLSDTAVATLDTTSTNIYAWGTKECFGGWPGSPVQTWEKETLFGLTLSHYTIECHVGDYFNLIVNNQDAGLGGKYQYNGIVLEATEAYNEYYLKIGDKAITPLELSVKSPRRH